MRAKGKQKGGECIPAFLISIRICSRVGFRTSLAGPTANRPDFGHRAVILFRGRSAAIYPGGLNRLEY
jgi:hypothetical protein